MINRREGSGRFAIAVLFFVILVLGIFALVWKFASIPPGLMVDEASIGVEAYDLYKYGIDRNGISYPVHFIAWGDMQQNVLYAYLLIPFIALGGLNPFFTRLPMVIAGILSLPLMYYVGRKLGGERFGLFCMFLMAISPWHVSSARWALEYNIFPFIFLLGFACMLASEADNLWFLPCCVAFAVSLYSYATSYAAVPIFLLPGIAILLYYRRVTFSTLVIGLTAFAVLALPVFLFVIVNIFKLDTIHLGLVTIPRIPGEARFQYMTAIFGNSPLMAMAENIAIMFRLLWQQSDSVSGYYVQPFGYFYKLTFPFAIGGFFLIIPMRGKRTFERWLLFIWTLAALSIGILLPVSLTRINLIFTPLLICIGFFLFELDKHVKYLLWVSCLALSIGFIFFSISYHGDDYQRVAGGVFNAGMIPAVEYASERADGEICITESVYYAYIYVLYTQKFNPAGYINRIEWRYYLDDMIHPMRTPKRLDRFVFLRSSCSNTIETAYILSLKEPAPLFGVNYKEKRFSKFKVLIPKP